MAKFVAMVIPQHGFDEHSFHEMRKAFASKNVLVLIASKQKTSAYGDATNENFLPNMTIGEMRVDRYDALLLMGGKGFAYDKDVVVKHFIMKFLENSKPVCAVGNATSALDGIKSSLVMKEADTQKAKEFGLRISNRLLGIQQDSNL